MFMNHNEYECPNCHRQLEDVVIDGVDYKRCNNNECVGETIGVKEWRTGNFGTFHD